MVHQPYYQRFVAPNGLRILVEEIPYVRSVSIGVWVATGSRYEELEQAGMTHLIEHLLFKGTERRNARQIAEEMDAVGGQLNAFTAKEHTCYYARVLDEHFDLALEVLSDMILRSTFDEAELEKEKGVVIEEIKMYDGAPDELVHDLFSAVIWPDHPLGRNIVGTVPVLKAMSRAGILDYYRKHYLPTRMVVAVAGNVQAQRVREAVEQAFAEFPHAAAGGDGGLPNPGDVAACFPPAPHPGLELRAKDAEQLHLCLGGAGLPHEHDDLYPLYVINNALGGGSSSRLFQEIREKRGWAYSVYSYLSTYHDTGLFTIYAGVSPEQGLPVLELVLDELRRMKREGLTPEELQRAKEQMKGQMVMSLDSVSNRMSRLGRSEITIGRVLSPDEVIQRVAAVTAEDVARVADQTLSGTLTLTAVGALDRSGALGAIDRTL